MRELRFLRGEEAHRRGRPSPRSGATGPSCSCLRPPEHIHIIIAHKGCEACRELVQHVHVPRASHRGRMRRLHDLTSRPAHEHRLPSLAILFEERSSKYVQIGRIGCHRIQRTSMGASSAFRFFAVIAVWVPQRNSDHLGHLGAQRRLRTGRRRTWL